MLCKALLEVNRQQNLYICCKKLSIHSIFLIKNTSRNTLIFTKETKCIFVDILSYPAPKTLHL